MILVFITIFFSYYLISYYFVRRKEKVFFESRKVIFNIKYLAKSLRKIEYSLKILNYPYKLNIYNYVVIKICSVIIFPLSYLVNKNIFFSVIIFLLLFFTPDIFIKLFKFQEKKNVISDIVILVTNLELGLNVGLSIYYSLKFSILNLKYYPFKNFMDDLLEKYKIYNFDMVKASKNLLERFNFEEMHTFIHILSGDKSLKNISKTLSLYKDTIIENKYKNLKLYYLKNNYKILFLTICLLLISFCIVIYPISVQVIDNLNIMLS